MAPTSASPILLVRRGILDPVWARTGSVVRGVGFWTAILLPVLYLPMLLLNHPWAIDSLNLLKIVGLHWASIVVGSGYGGGQS